MATGISGFIEQVGSMIRGIPKHELASTPVSVHRQLSSSEPDNSQQMVVYELVFIG